MVGVVPASNYHPVRMIRYGTVLSGPLHNMQGLYLGIMHDYAEIMQRPICSGDGPICRNHGQCLESLAICVEPCARYGGSPIGGYGR